MNLFYERMAKYDLPQQMKEKGIYPYFREISGKQGTEVEMDGRSVLMFGSNAYTGLTGDERVINAGIEALKKYGSGCAGSRFLNGTLDIHVQLEKELATFVGKDETLVFSTGFTVNSGVIPQLLTRNDYIICDDRDHASIVDGRRLSFAKSLHYKHNDMKDLERCLRRCPPQSVKLIVVDGVFSMEGDLAKLPAKLPEIVELKHKHKNVVIMVDEAHGLGVFGRQGRGVCDHFGLTDEVDLIMGTFSKSLAAIGGFIAADRVIINHLRHTARTYIFQASDTPAATACALVCVFLGDQIYSGQHPNTGAGVTDTAAAETASPVHISADCSDNHFPSEADAPSVHLEKQEIVEGKEMEFSDRVIEYLKETYQPDAIITYGSFADGTANENSDFDALVIADNKKRHDASVIDSTTLVDI